MAKLTRNEAISLITPVVDGEASEEEIEQLFAYMEQDLYVRELYDQEQEIKRFIKQNIRLHTCPPHLESFVNKVGIYHNYSDYPSKELIADLPCRQRPLYQFSTFIIASTAALLLGAFTLLFLTNSDRVASDELVVIEKNVIRHFENLSEEQPELSTPELSGGDDLVFIDYWDSPIQVPRIEEATFGGFATPEFAKNLQTPMLSYTCREGHPIYVFAFDMNQLSGKLKPNSNATTSCISSDDFYISEIEGRQVVSWKWNNIWYAAISKHSADRLTKMLLER